MAVNVSVCLCLYSSTRCQLTDSLPDWLGCCRCCCCCYCRCPGLACSGLDMCSAVRRHCLMCVRRPRCLLFRSLFVLFLDSFFPGRGSLSLLGVLVCVCALCEVLVGIEDDWLGGYPDHLLLISAFSVLNFKPLFFFFFFDDDSSKKSTATLLY